MPAAARCVSERAAGKRGKTHEDHTTQIRRRDGRVANPHQGVVRGVLKRVSGFVTGNADSRQRAVLKNVGAQAQDLVARIIVIAELAGNLLNLHVMEPG